MGCSAQTSPNLGLGKRARRSTVEAAYRSDWVTNVLVLVFQNLMFVERTKRSYPAFGSSGLAWIIHDSCSQKEKDALKG